MDAGNIMNILAARIHRTLRKLQGFREFTSKDVPGSAWINYLHEGEQPIGLYSNEGASVTKEILVTDKGILFGIPGGHIINLAYQDMEVAYVPENDKETRALHMRCSDGTVHILEITGGGTRFRDSLAFLRFFDRAINDVQNSK
jgi:hypothetical protein